MMHFLKKLSSTLRIAFTLILARTFGKYEYSIYDPSGFTYAKYRWRNKTWGFPTQAIEDDSIKVELPEGKIRLHF